MSVRRATIVSMEGTTGDVAYLASIAQELQRAGVSTRMLLPKVYLEQTRFALEAAGLRDLGCVDPSSPEFAASVAPATPAIQHERRARRHVESVATCLQVCREATTGDVIIGDASSATKLALLARAAAVPYFQVSPMPYIPTREFYMGSPAPLLTPRLNLLRWKRRMKHWSWAATRGILQRLRDHPALAREWRSAIGRRGLSVRRWDRYYRHELAHIVCASPQVIPRPADWSRNITCLPYCAWDTSVLPVDPRLAAFVDAGPPPVYVGFGSFAPIRYFGERGWQLLRGMADAAQASGARIVFCGAGIGAGRAADVPANTCLVDAAPHRWLFPRCQAVVCHGGYGTVHTALVSGMPLIVYPYQTDQFLIASRLERQGVGAPYRTLYKNFTVADFARDLDWLARHEEVRARARLVGGLIAREGGPRAAANAMLTMCDTGSNGVAQAAAMN